MSDTTNEAERLDHQIFGRRIMGDRWPPMTLWERIRAAAIIIRSSYIERVDIRWTRDDERPASRIHVGRMR